MTIEPGMYVVLVKHNDTGLLEHLYRVLDTYPKNLVHIYRDDPVFRRELAPVELIVDASQLVVAEKDGYTVVGDYRLGLKNGWEWFEYGRWQVARETRANQARFPVRRPNLPGEGR